MFMPLTTADLYMFVYAKRMFSWMSQLLYDFRKHKNDTEFICKSEMDECGHATIQIRYK